MSAEDIAGMRDFVALLNSAGGGAAVAVEGRRDSAALRRLGYSGVILEFNRFGGMVDFADHAARYDTVIVLFDRDRKGRYMTGRVARLLQRRTNVEMSFRRRLWKLTRGRVTFIEQLACYAPPVALF